MRNGMTLHKRVASRLQLRVAPPSREALSSLYKLGNERLYVAQAPKCRTPWATTDQLSPKAVTWMCVADEALFTMLYSSENATNCTVEQHHFDIIEDGDRAWGTVLTVRHQAGVEPRPDPVEDTIRRH